eukprot:251501_1
MQAITNPRIVMLLSAMLFSLIMHSGFAKKKKQQTISKLQSNGAYLTIYVEKYWLFIQLFLIGSGLYVLYDVYANDKRMISVTHIIGTILYIFSYIIRNAVIKIHNAQNELKLITNGPYSYVRHPAYLAAFLRA